MSKYYVCDWCGARTRYVDDFVSLTFNEPSLSDKKGPATAHICMECLPETPMAEQMLRNDGEGPDLSGLSKTQRKDYEAVILGDLSHEEQAEHRDVQPQTVRASIRRANKELNG